MQRGLTATIGLVVVLAVAGCGKDDPSGASANSATTATVASDAAAGNGVGAQAGATKRAGSKDSGSKTSGSKKKASSAKQGSGSKASGSTSATSKTSSGSKKSSVSKPSAAKTPASSDAAASPTGAGSQPAPAGDSPEARLAVVAVVRRYQKDFIDGDGDDACSLLTAAGKKQMTSGGRGRTCAESVNRVLDQSRPSDIKLIRRTRAGIRVDDVAIRGASATVDIGKGQRLRLARQDGKWLVSDPSP